MKVIQNYTLTLNFVKDEIIDIQKNILICKAKQFMMKKENNSKKSLHILEDGVQVGDIRQVIV